MFSAAHTTDSCSSPFLFVSWAIELLVLQIIVLLSLPSAKLLLLRIIVQLVPNDPDCYFACADAVGLLLAQIVLLLFILEDLS